MEISADTQLYINLWTIIAVIFFFWRLSSSITKFRENTEMQLKDHERRVKEIEWLDLKAILLKIQTDLERIKENMHK
jgi:hypothetical protein